MSTRFIAARLFAVCCICAAGILGLRARAESGGTPQGRKLTLGELCERIDVGLKMAETNSDEKVYKPGIFLGAVQDVNAIGRLGDRAALPFLEEKGLSTNTYQLIRERAAAAYVKIADLDESVEFIKKMNADPSANGRSWRYFLNKQFLDKIATEEKMNSVTADNLYSCLLEIVQNSKNSEEANMVERFLLDRIPEYRDSKQRATLQRYVNTGNEWDDKTFNPIKAHFDNIPPSKRVDLRARFHGLPPLPGDKTGKPLTVALAVSAGLAALAAACVTIWFALKRRRARNHADGQPDNPQ